MAELFQTTVQTVTGHLQNERDEQALSEVLAALPPANPNRLFRGILATAGFQWSF